MQTFLHSIILEISGFYIEKYIHFLHVHVRLQDIPLKISRTTQPQSLDPFRLTSKALQILHRGSKYRHMVGGGGLRTSFC